MSARPNHRCEDRDCPYIGQPSPRSCLCHKTTEQLLTEQRDGLVEALEAISAEAERMTMTMRRRKIFDAAREVLARARGEQP